MRSQRWRLQLSITGSICKLDLGSTPHQVLHSDSTHVSLSSVNESLEHVLSIVEPIASKLNFTLDLNGSHKDVEVNVIRLGLIGALEPAPLTPTSGPVWDLVAGTTRR
jgi:hypothetical protein